VLPTAGTARFSSVLGVEDFVRRVSVIEYSRTGLAAGLAHLRTLADGEGLGAHRAAADARATQEGTQSA
jgi:histidinol dehydrogenase